jgi:hypothetical protein
VFQIPDKNENELKAAHKRGQFPGLLEERPMNQPSRLLACVGVIVLLGHLCAALDRAQSVTKRAKRAEAAKCEDVKDLESCHSSYAAGCTNAKAVAYDAYLSFVKNLTPSPKSSTKPIMTFHSLDDMKPLMQLVPSLAKPRNQAQHAASLAAAGEGNIYALIGYLYYASPGGKETCNCQLSNPLHKDFHIGIGFEPARAARIAAGTEDAHGTSTQSAAAQKTSVIVEMTPHFRAKYQPAWTLPEVQSAVGKQVKVVGQLLLDSEHTLPNQDCELARHSKKCWRATAWELHPVIRFYVCKTEQACSDESPNWEELDEYEPE